MTTTVSRLLATAAGEIGTVESPANSNRCKYTSWYGLVGPWCSIFVDWVCVTAGAGDMRNQVTGSWASCQGALDALRREGRVHANKKSAQPGDVVYFDWNNDRHVDHTGLIVEVHPDGVVTIEGNTSGAGSQSNGGEVMRRFRAWSLVAATASLPNVVADGSPSAPPAVTPPPPPPPSPAAAGSLAELAKNLAYCRLFTIGDGYNTSDMAVRFVQMGLNASKCVGPVVVDGAWGPFTLAAVKHFQQVHHLLVDGIVGPATWSALYP
jgi:hypothetical protein